MAKGRLTRRFLGSFAVGCLMLVLAPAPAHSVPTEYAHRFAAGAPVRSGPWRYADPGAQKGGEVRLAALGTFDSLHPYAMRGVAPGVAVGLTVDTLMVPSGDEPLARHCLVCETVEIAPDRSWMELRLRPEARFHDGSPVTPEDVAWTVETLKAQGHAFFRMNYADILRVEKTGPARVKLSFAPSASADLPLLVGDLPVLSRAWWQGRDFARPTLEPPLGSGPYRVEAVEPGRSIVLNRVPTYWAVDLPINKGRHNFDAIRFDYYRDDLAALEAFKAGLYDIRLESEAHLWATAYDGPALAAGLIVKDEVPEDRVSGMSGFVMNTRRPLFQDRRVREALAYALDFEWINRVFLRGAYTRTRSYFNNADLAARGPPDATELAILNPFRGRVPDEVFAREYQPPRTDGSGDWRANRRHAVRLLKEAGLRVVADRLIDGAGNSASFEILLDAAPLERIALTYAANLAQLGVEARIRTVDAAQYQRRLARFDFDMTPALLGQSESPGREQRHYWSSSAADIVGSANLAGVRDPAVDAVVDLLIAAPDHKALVARTHALDRLLQWGHYVVPFWHSKVDRVASWNRFARPAATPRAGVDISFWWIDPAKDAALRQRHALPR
jgi:microcin C transport system substrate-binding protein